MKKQISLVVILLIIAVVFVSYFSQNKSQQINIGAVLPLTGAVSGLGESLKMGYEWKLKELNAEGLNYSLIIEDSASNPKDGVSALNKLINSDKVNFVFTTMSGVAMSLKPITEERGILLWANVAHPYILSDSKIMLRHSNTSDSDANTIGNKVIELKSKNVAILYQNDDWGKVASDLLGKKLNSANIQVINEAIDIKSADFRNSILAGLNKKVDTIVTIAAGPASGLIIKQSRELGFVGQIVSSVGIVLTPEAQKIAGNYLKGTYYQTYDVGAAFAEDYRKQFGSDPAAFTIAGYTDLELLSSAIKKTNSTSPEKIVEYIKTLGEFEGKYETVKITPGGDIVVPTVVKQW